MESLVKLPSHRNILKNPLNFCASVSISVLERWGCVATSVLLKTKRWEQLYFHHVSQTPARSCRGIFCNVQKCDYLPVCLLSNNNKMAFLVLLWIKWIMLWQRVDHCSELLILYLLLCQYIHFSVFCLIFCPLAGAGKVISPSGECLYVFLPQRRGNTPHTAAWWSGPPRCCLAGLVPPGHPVSLIQSVSAARPVSELHKKKKKKSINVSFCHWGTTKLTMPL